MILLDSYYDSGQNEVFVEIGARAPDIWLDMSFWPKLP